MNNVDKKDRSFLTTKTSNKKPLGLILVEAGLISIGQVELALQEQKECGLKIGEILVLHGWIKEETVDFFADKWLQLLQQEEKKPLLFYFKEAALLDDDQITILTKLQQFQQKKVRFHNLAIDRGYIQRRTVDFFMANLFNIYNPQAVSLIKPFEIFKKYSKGETDFRKSDLRQAPLMGVTLKGVNLSGSNCRKINFNGANLSNSSLIQVNLSRADLSKAILTQVNFTQSKLKKANLQDAHLEGVNFTKAILKEADLTRAYLFKADFSDACLEEAKLPSEYSYDVYYNSKTQFSIDFDPQKAGWSRKD